MCFWASAISPGDSRGIHPDPAIQITIDRFAGRIILVGIHNAAAQAFKRDARRVPSQGILDGIVHSCARSDALLQALEILQLAQGCDLRVVERFLVRDVGVAKDSVAEGLIVDGKRAGMISGVRRRVVCIVGAIAAGIQEGTRCVACCGGGSG